MLAHLFYACMHALMALEQQTASFVWAATTNKDQYTHTHNIITSATTHSVRMHKNNNNI